MQAYISSCVFSSKYLYSGGGYEQGYNSKPNADQWANHHKPTNTTENKWSN